jgi:small-conductance mechanosensitive channel
VDDISALLAVWVAALGERSVQLQLALVVILSALSYAFVRLIKWRLAHDAAVADPSPEQRSLVQVARLGNVIWLLLAALFLLIASRVAEAHQQPSHLLRVAVLIYFAGGAIRLALYAIRRVFRPSGVLALFQRAITSLVWLVVVLHLAGLLPYVTDALESVGVYQLSGTGEEINLLQILQGTFYVALTLVVALWAGTVLEHRLMRSSSLDVSLQVALGRFGRALLVVIAVLVSMQVVGIPLGMLSVFGGALGVGLGLGLQRIASNYISGFIILLDRSLRIGDLIAVDKYTGSVSQIRTRYTVVKALDGTEAILPNELLVSSPVLNHSFTSRQTRLAVKYQVAYESDVEAVIDILIAAALTESRVLRDPAPTAFLTAFAPDGLDMELGFWLADPEAGSGQVRSNINREVLKAFRAAKVAIPSPKRDIRVEYVTSAGRPEE